MYFSAIRRTQPASNNGGVSPPTTPKGGPDAGGHGEVGLSRRWFCGSQASFQSNDAVDPKNTQKIKRLKKNIEKNLLPTRTLWRNVPARRVFLVLFCFLFCIFLRTLYLAVSPPRRTNLEWAHTLYADSTACIYAAHPREEFRSEWCITQRLGVAAC